MVRPKFQLPLNGCIGTLLNQLFVLCVIGLMSLMSIIMQSAQYFHEVRRRLYPNILWTQNILLFDELMKFKGYRNLKALCALYNSILKEL